MADLNRLLESTSRTFALSIPALDEPLRTEVTVAYLLFRIADTFEDAADWPQARRVEALAEFAAWVRDVAAGQAPNEVPRGASWNQGVAPSEHRGYRELVAATADVLQAFHDLTPAARAAIGHHTMRTAQGMAEFVTRADDEGRLVLGDLADLQAYCYVVAGIVGELLTELFLLAHPGLEPRRAELLARAATFGEALQLVNILKDAASDAREGRTFLPASAPRAEVFALARRDLDSARRYVLDLQQGGAPTGLLTFTALPVAFAEATLARVERDGAGAKITRTEVATIALALAERLAAGDAAF
ncbi:MAG: squalene/phytoene synthase family protein [Thermoanaerobaculia bacterium]|nr:squalene/phytoene synthase family protein [Thermoanaerobaculia bacterium]